jgi:undecaprenyl phosphate-alpha-L-ara4FN deformylase
MDRQALGREIRRGFDLLAGILGRAPDGFAAPAWRVTPEALLVLDRFPFRLQSDCRGTTLFRPKVDGRALEHVQVPVTLPTYDEIVGRQCSQQKFNDFLLEMIEPQRLNVLTIHAEVEGIGSLHLFRDFLEKSRPRSIAFKTLGALLNTGPKIATAGVKKAVVAGREGWLACQQAITG